MKKLNRKGFTLIELLAVIVILAIIVVVTVPTIITTIEDARVNSIWNLAGSTANSYDTMKAQDLIATNKVLEGYNVTTTWTCIGAITKTGGSTLDSVLELSSNDLKLTGDADAVAADGTVTLTANSCSAIRLNANGNAEIFLVAKDGGKFAVSGSTVYALSTATNGDKGTTPAA